MSARTTSPRNYRVGAAPAPEDGMPPFDYPAAARSIALNLGEFCDESEPFPRMIAAAARHAADEIHRLRESLASLRSPEAGTLDERTLDAAERAVTVEVARRGLAGESFSARDLARVALASLSPAPEARTNAIERKYPDEAWLGEWSDAMWLLDQAAMICEDANFAHTEKLRALVRYLPTRAPFDPASRLRDLTADAARVAHYLLNEPKYSRAKAAKDLARHVREHGGGWTDYDLTTLLGDAGRASEVPKPEVRDAR